MDNHKRGRSFESGEVCLKQRDDDLALFKEVQSRGKDNFLLEGNNDFEDIFSMVYALVCLRVLFGIAF